MTEYYQLLEDGTIGMSTPFEDVAKDLGLELTTDREIVYGWNGKRYFKGEEPAKPQEMIDAEIDAGKVAIREEMIDKYTIRRMRKMANHTWTDEDEAEYLALDAKVTGMIEEKYGIGSK